MAIGDVYQLSLDQQVYGIGATNTMYFEQLSASAVGTEDEDSLIDAFLVDIVPTWADMCTDDWSTVCVRVIRVTFPGGVQFVKLNSTPGTRTLSVEGWPVNQNANVAFYSLPNPDQVMSRKFFTGLAEEDEEDGLLLQSALDLITTLTDRLVIPIEDSTTDGRFEWRNKQTLPEPAGAAWFQNLHTEVRTRVKKLRPRTQTLCDQS